MSSRRCAAATAALALLASLPSFAQPQFRAGTELVVVDVVATRADGNVARDLKITDFQILEDGRPQDIRTFQFVDLDASTRSADPTGVFSNQPEPGAVFAIVVDSLSVEPRHTLTLRRWAERFVTEQVQPGDYLGVMNTSADFALLLTRDHEVVRAKLAQASGRGTGLSKEAPSGRVQTATGDINLPDFRGVDQVDVTPEVRLTTEQALITLRQVVDYLSAIPARRKSVLYFSQGIALDLEALADKMSSRGFDAMGEMLDAARAGNVAIYGIDPRGLSADDAVAAAAAPLPTMVDAGVDGLRDLARATGGRALVNTSDLGGALGRIARENRAYFLLGYEPTNTSTAQRGLRRIEVTTRAPGVTLLYRTARVSATERAQSASRDFDASPLPGGTLRVVLAPSLYPGTGQRAALAVPFEIGATLPDKTRVEYALTALDVKGKQVAGVKGTVTADNGHGGGMARLQLAPGRYQVRLAAHMPDDAQRGVAFADVHVPAAGAAAPTCGGFLIIQKDGNTLRPNVTRQLAADQPLMVAALVSSRAPLTAARFSAASLDGSVKLSVPVPKAPRLSNGMWRYELALTPPLPAADLTLLLLDNDVPIPGCEAELHIK